MVVRLLDQNETFKAIEEDLSIWLEGVRSAKLEALTRIKLSVEGELIGKMDAIVLIQKYELLPLDSWLEYPSFMEGKITGDYYERGNRIFFAYILEDKDDFMPEDDSEPYKYATMPNITQEEAINLTYDFMMEHNIRGCHFDW